MDDFGPYDYYGARGKSVYDIIRELTGSKSIWRVHEYADVFHGSISHLAHYFALCAGIQGDWQFHRFSASQRTWVPQTVVPRVPPMKNLIIFAHGLKQPYEAAALWAPYFLKNRKQDGLFPVNGAKLRPFAEAGMSPSEVAALVYHNLPAAEHQAKTEMNYRLGRSKELIEMHRQGLAAEYIIAAGLL